MEKEINYKEEAHMIMKADKSQDLQSASWKLRRTDGVVPVWIPAGRPKKTHCSSKSLNAGKTNKQTKPHPQLKVRQEGFYSHAGGSVFCSIQAFNWLDEAHPHDWRQSASLSLQIQMPVSSKTPSLTSSSSLKMFYQVSGHPMTQLSQYM